MLPFFFFFDRTHYSRYGFYYIQSMERPEKTHLGAKQELMKIGILKYFELMKIEIQKVLDKQLT